MGVRGTEDSGDAVDSHHPFHTAFPPPKVHCMVSIPLTEELAGMIEWDLVNDCRGPLRSQCICGWFAPLYRTVPTALPLQDMCRVIQRGVLGTVPLAVR